MHRALLTALLISCSALLTAPAARAVDDKPVGKADSAGGLQPYDRKAEPKIAPESGEAAQVLKQLGLPAGMKAELWAAEPALANPVALSIDEKGRVFVAETQRLGSSVLDIRNYMFMLEDDLACRTVEDRIAMCKKHFGDKFADLEKEEDYIRLLEDRDHDGKADFSSMYARGFNRATDGIPAGVLARHGTVWATIIPDLWRFDGTNDRGEAVEKKSLSHGYGVRFGYTGHDMHGLIMGPDGRLYFSIGDRGANVMTEEGKRIENPDSGAVFRCEPDGSKLEIIHWGLRNPQELAFDDHGNLFTGDNDFDYGDTERLVYIVEGGDSGWRVGYQHPPLGKERVPWKAEQIWMSFISSQEKYNGVPNPKVNVDLGVRPATYLPPVSNIGDGPSGLLFDTGTGISPQFRNHFLLCHSKGSYARSEIRAFTLKEDGASFVLGETRPFLQFIHSPDLELAPDGSVYVLDWAETMSKTAKGRIFRVYDPEVMADALTLETKRYLEQGLKLRELPQLMRLLQHPDRRVRMEAQFELTTRGPEGMLALKVASGAGPMNIPGGDVAPVATLDPLRLERLRRLHAIWGLGIMGRKDPAACASLPALLKSADSEVRAQAAKVLGDVKYADAAGALTHALQDDAPRVKYFAAQSLGKLKAKTAAKAIMEALKQNNNKDAHQRHACVMALYGMCTKGEGFKFSPDQLVEDALDEVLLLDPRSLLRPDQSGVALAMSLLSRRLNVNIGPLMEASTDTRNTAHSKLLKAMGDEMARMIDEAVARSSSRIPKTDEESPKAVRNARAQMFAESLRASTEDRPSLEAPDYRQIGTGNMTPLDEVIVRRALYSWFLQHAFAPQVPDEAHEANATWIATIAASADRGFVSADNQLVALTFLGEWATPQTRNHFTGLTFSSKWQSRNAGPAIQAIARHWNGLMNNHQATEVRIAAIDAVRKLKATTLAPKLVPLVKDSTQPAPLRLAALTALGDWDDRATLAEAIAAAQTSNDPTLRAATLKLLPKVDPEHAVAVLETTLASGDEASQRGALEVLGGLPAGKADALLAAQLDQLSTGKVKPGVMLDVIDAARRRADDAVKTKLQAYLQSLPQVRNATAFPYLLQGGDAKAGKKVFYEHTAAQCVRCHKIGGNGSDVGPPLDGIATKHPREYLLEAVLFPNNAIAPGFEMTMVTLKDGKTFGGMVRKETDTELQLSAPVPNAPLEIVKKADIQARLPGISAMPEIMQQVMTQQQIRDLLAYLGSLKEVGNK